MTKEQKSVLIDEITEKLQSATAVYLTDYQGLSVAQSNELRGLFRESGIDYKVLKNTLIKRAMESIGGYENIYDHLNGATAVAFTTDPAAPAKVLKEYLKGKEVEIPKFKVAYVDGSVFSQSQFEALASLKSKDEILGDIVGLLLAPITNVVGALQAQGSNLVGAIKTIAEKEEN